MRINGLRQSAFSFLEIMVVVAILAFFAGLVVPRFRLGNGELKPKLERQQMGEIMKALERYRFDNGCYPSTEQGLKALVEKPSCEPKPTHWRPYLAKVPLDTWKHHYAYRCPGDDHGREDDGDQKKNIGTCDYYDLSSYGDDGEQSDDDINSWNIPEER